MTSQKTIFEYAIGLLSSRPYHCNELEKKLKAKKYGQKEIKETINKLKKYNYINDRQYIKLFIESQVKRKPQGLRLIRQKLLQRGIPADAIDNEICGIRIDEKLLAEKAVLKKIKTLKATTPSQQKEKLFRFLASRGFSTPVTIQTLNRYLK